MRLIDADKTKYSLWGFERYTGIDEMPMEYAEEIIDKQPTVEAIPIEWIKKWLNNIANNERYKNDYVELTEEVKRIVYRQEMMIIKIPCISDMLEDWKKENERNV